ncbi:unnamed protein product, partial [Heterosigma akashiwo]
MESSQDDSFLFPGKGIVHRLEKLEREIHLPGLKTPEAVLSKSAPKARRSLPGDGSFRKIGEPVVFPTSKANAHNFIVKK